MKIVMICAFLMLSASCFAQIDMFEGRIAAVVDDIHPESSNYGWRYTYRDSTFYISSGSLGVRIEADGLIWFRCSVLERREKQGYRYENGQKVPGSGYKYKISLWHNFDGIRFKNNMAILAHMVSASHVLTRLNVNWR
jgi:hypothetical protein